MRKFKCDLCDLVIEIEDTEEEICAVKALHLGYKHPDEGGILHDEMLEKYEVEL